MRLLSNTPSISQEQRHVSSAGFTLKISDSQAKNAKGGQGEHIWEGMMGRNQLTAKESSVVFPRRRSKAQSESIDDDSQPNSFSRIVPALWIKSSLENKSLVYKL